ncbi:MAG: Hsp33 family molecular chaperone HslO [Clostridia bacterium]|nr:Hsp33 family molecular chaperone HslO [Clostridia bacterium]
MDRIISGLCLDDTIRISAISAAGMIETAQRTHGLSRVATAALGRQLMMTAMMAARLKDEDSRLTTIIAGDGLAGNMVCSGKPDGTVKGYTPNPEVELPLKPDGKIDVGGYVGHGGKLTVISDLSMKEPYVGTCNLVSGEIAEDFAQYFLTSEQQPSIVYLGVQLRADTNTVIAGGGLFISALPNCPDEAVDRVSERIAKIAEFTSSLAEGEPIEAALEAIFEGLNFRIVETKDTGFVCDCSRDRLEKALISVGEKDLCDIIEQDGQAELTCQFCNKKYFFDREQLTELLTEARHE